MDATGEATIAARDKLRFPVRQPSEVGPAACAVSCS